MRYCPAMLALVALAIPAPAEEMVPFVIPADPNPASAIAVKAAPVPTDAPRLVVRDGHFAVGGERVRVWGVNLCFSACFPKPEDAPRIACRMAAAGVNSVRFHHMDSQPWPRGILDPKDQTKLVPEALERLDVFLDQLARHGIRANLNLHVGRAASRALGMPKANTRYDKIVGIFTPRLVEAQKQYARDLLGRTSSVRKVRYADDPAVAFVEITNEDSLFMWSAKRDLRALPDHYAGVLRGKFNAWLKARYGSTGSLRKAWAEGAQPLGENMLADTDFTMARPDDESAKRWQLEQHDGCRMKAEPLKDVRGVRLTIAKADGTTWHLQFKQVPLALRGDRYYTLMFRARAEEPRSIGYAVSQDHEPWGNLGLSGQVHLTREWQAVRAGFTATKDDDRARLSFSLGGDASAVELADVAFRPGGREGLRDAESLEKQNVAVFAPGEVEARTRDRWRFLAETEKAYFDEMRRFVKEDVGYKGLVTGTIVYGPCGLYGQSDMDFIDGHAYWQHPRFPGRPWDSGNWLIQQIAMTDHPDGSTLCRLAAQRLAGKPYTVSEYNHPAPNDYQAECVPMLASFAAAQDWDGIWLFTYSHSEQVDRGALHSYFDIDQNPAKWGFMRAGTAIFRRGTVPPLATTRRVALADAKADALGGLVALHRAHDRDLFAAVADGTDVSCQDLLRERLAVTLAGETKTVSHRVDHAPALSWQMQDGRGTYAVEARGTRVLIGHRGSRAAGLDLRKPAFAAVTVTSLDGWPLAASRAVLVAACGRAENTGMVFSKDRRTVGRNWGQPPVRIEPVEGAVELPRGKWT
ncbi:MAG: carbohydrate binding domain-containing protein, partial [Planctomycetota bacterium]|nr:carbohydrate binding domain-containing protein [Planctomycetota bacterium]